VQSKAFTVSRLGDMSWASSGSGLEQGRFMKAVNDRRGSYVLCSRIDGRRVIRVVHDVGKTFDNGIEWVNFDGVWNGIVMRPHYIVVLSR
jgi:hypothetical protein